MTLPPAYSDNFVAVELPTGGFSTSYEPPAGYRWLITCCTIYTPAYAAANAVFIADSASGCVIAGAEYEPGTLANFETWILNHVVYGFSGIECYSTGLGTTFYVSGKTLADA